MKKLILFLALAAGAIAQPVQQISTANVSGTLYFGGATTGGNITGASGALSFTALGTNQTITVAPSGTGYVWIAPGGTTGLPAVSGSSLRIDPPNGSAQSSVYQMGYGGGGKYLYVTSGGTAAAQTAVASNNLLGVTEYLGYYTSPSASYATGALFAAVTQEAWTSTTRGTGFSWRTTAIGTASLATKMALLGNGNLLLGIAGASNLGTDNGNGLLQIPSTGATNGIALGTRPDEVIFRPGVNDTIQTNSTFIAKGTTTNNNAAVGYIGEFLSSVIASGSAVSLSSATTANVTSISLTAGDWDVFSVVYFTQGATTTATAYSAGITSTSATLPGNNAASQANEPGTGVALIAGNPVPTLEIIRVRQSLAATTTIYLVAQSTFLVSTNAAFGGISARRVR